MLSKKEKRNLIEKALLKQLNILQECSSNCSEEALPRITSAIIDICLVLKG